MYFFFFKQKTAYEMRISDWSSDVCSSDLRSQRTQLPLIRGHVVQIVMRIEVAFVQGKCRLSLDLGYKQLGFGHQRRANPVNRAIPTGRIPARHITTHNGVPMRVQIRRRSEERRLGTECVRTCSSRVSQYTAKKK